MTNQGSRNSVGVDHWKGRLHQAREVRESARTLVTLESSSTYNPAIALIVACAIAYSDAITAKRKGVVNTQDHAAAVRDCFAMCLATRCQSAKKSFTRVCSAASTR